MTRRKTRLCIAAIAAVFLTCAAGHPALSQEPTAPLRIRLIHGIPTATIYSMIEAKKDILPNYGKDYIVEARRIDASSEIAIVLAGGGADMGFTATGAMINTNRKLNAELRMVADVVQNGVHGHNASWFAVRADDAIKEVKDLKGKTIATLGFGTFADLAMRVGLKKGGIDPAKDVTIVQVPFPAMEANLREKKVDLIQLVPPFYQISTGKGGLRVLYTGAESLGPTQTLMLAASAEFLAKNPRRVQSFFDDYYRFLQYGLNPQNRDEMIEIGAKMQNIPAAAFKSWWNTKEDFFRDPEGLVNVAAVKSEMGVLKEYGIIEVTVDIEKWVDMSFMRKAAQNSKR